MICVAFYNDDQCVWQALVKVSEFVHCEQVPYTQNHNLYKNISKLWLKRLMDELLQMLGKHDAKGAEVDRLLVVVATVHSVFKRNQAKPMDNHMAEEMEDALDGYGKVALKRFIDNVPMICIEVMQKLPNCIKNVLLDVMDNEINWQRICGSFHHPLCLPLLVFHTCTYHPPYALYCEKLGVSIHCLLHMANN
jgi:hypothetical protein